jgi:hypothetical protein
VSVAVLPRRMNADRCRKYTEDFDLISALVACNGEGAACQQLAAKKLTIHIFSCERDDEDVRKMVKFTEDCRLSLTGDFHLALLKHLHEEFKRCLEESKA